MTDVIDFARYRNIRLARELDRMEARFEARNQQAALNPMFVLGRDAGSIADCDPIAVRHQLEPSSLEASLAKLKAATDRLKASNERLAQLRDDLIQFAKTGAPPEPSDV